MLKITLTGEQEAKLTETYRCTADRRLRERSQAVLMAARGRRRGAIAQDLAVSLRSVLRWWAAFAAGGLEALPPS